MRVRFAPISVRRDRGQEGDGVRVQRPCEEVGRVCQLDHLPEIHDRDPVGDVPDHGEIVCDEQVGQPEVLLQLDEQVEDLGLDRDVERRHRLVGDDQLRPQDERAGDPDALALPAAELVRVAAQGLRPEPDALERVDDSIGPLLTRHSVDGQPLADDVFHPHPRVERADGVLEDDLHLAPGRTQVGPGRRHQVAAVELDRPLGRLDQPDQRPPERRLPAARLADQPERLAAADLDVDAVDGLDVADRPPQQAVVDREVLLDPLRIEQHIRRAHACLTSTFEGSRCPCSHSQHAESRPSTSKSGGCSVSQRSKA